jgi:hypothetical protein
MPKAPEKKTVKKTVVAEKANTAPKSKPLSNDGRSVHADEPVLGVRWTARRVACVKAMRALGATNEAGAVPAEDIAKKMGTVEGIKMADRVDLVKIMLDVYRTSELIHNKYAKSTKHEGERSYRYYLTANGVKTAFPEDERKVSREPKEKAEKPAAKPKAEKKAETKPAGKSKAEKKLEKAKTGPTGPSAEEQQEENE